MSRFTTYHGGKAVIKDRAMISKAMEKLAKYEDAEAAGRLAELPCALGDKFYWIAEIDERGMLTDPHIAEDEITGIGVGPEGFYIRGIADIFEREGTRWALTSREAAEKMLEIMKGEQE